MSAWSTEDIKKLEEEAAKLPSMREISWFLQARTGLGFLVCTVWAEFIWRKTRHEFDDGVS